MSHSTIPAFLAYRDPAKVRVVALTAQYPLTSVTVEIGWGECEYVDK